MPNKKTVGIYSASGCGGCSQSVMFSTKLAAMLDASEIAFWATESADLTTDDIAKLDDKGLDLLIYAGPVHGEDCIEKVKLLRGKSKRVVAYGACAHLGGLCGLANLVPGAQLRGLPATDGEEGFVQPLSAVIDVDYILPGCPPPEVMITRMVEDIFLSDELPEPGTVFAEEKSVCAECSRTHAPQPLTAIRRFHADPPDPEICLLDQGYICLGPMTRGGCGAICLESNRACTGCSGPIAGVQDQGGAILYALASLVSFSGDDHEHKEQQVLDSIPDVVGTAYKYSAASSLLKRRVNDGE
ncbi:MAG: hypothetical protein U9Q94_08570 [Candidatus Bipolaricaulota bacterium]|nr:hypothetical protein [Candidatus Bipolaricaulota bacterium]